MINEKQLFCEGEEEITREYDYSFDTKIKRLQSTLFGRLTLVNVFKKLTDKNYIPLTLKNISVNIESQDEIERFLLKSTDWIESRLVHQVRDWMINNGSDFQKNRVLEYFK